MKRAIVNCHMIDVRTGVIRDNATILWENNMIKELSEYLELSSDIEVIDGTGCYVRPGLINGYTYLGLKEVGCDEKVDDSYKAAMAQPHLSVINGIYPFDKGFEFIKSAGVTIAHVSPSPGNVIAGMTSTIKTNGSVIDEMIMRSIIDYLYR